MPQFNTPYPRFDWLRAGATLAAIQTGALLIMILLLEHFATTNQTIVALSTAAACLVIALMAQMPVSWMSNRHIEGAAIGFIAGSVLRMGLTLFSAMVITELLGAQVVLTVAWTLIWYVLLLIFEVWLVSRYLLARSQWANSYRHYPC